MLKRKYKIWGFSAHSVNVVRFFVSYWLTFGIIRRLELEKFLRNKTSWRHHIMAMPFLRSENLLCYLLFNTLPSSVFTSFYVIQVVRTEKQKTWALQGEAYFMALYKPDFTISWFSSSGVTIKMHVFARYLHTCIRIPW